MRSGSAARGCCPISRIWSASGSPTAYLQCIARLVQKIASRTSLQLDATNSHAHHHSNQSVCIAHRLLHPRCAETLTGPATVVDADTIVVGGERIRLQGIDAPETDQICLDSKGVVWS